MIKKVRDMSLLSKLTIGYIVFVLIPVIFISFYSYDQIQQFYRYQIINEKQKYNAHIKNSIIQKMEIIKNTSESIVYNSEILNFLENRFTHASYSIYSERIYPIINYIISNSKVKICNIRIFMHNTTIPEGWEYFFSDERLLAKEWYKKFIDSDERELWLRINGKDYFKNWSLRNASDKDEFIYLQKIMNYDQTYLGTIAIEISDENLLFLETNKIDNDLFFLYNQDTLYTSKNIKDYFPVDSIGDLFVNNEGNIEYNQSLFIYDIIDKLNVKFGLVASLTAEKKAFNSLILNTIFIICATIFLIVNFYVLIGIFFRNIRNCMNIMNKVVQGDFSLRVPVKGKNEISVIAENFNLMIQKINELINDIVKKEIAKKEAQINALQYQINPHFFYNTLDILAGKMVLTGNYDIADTIADFGKMLRYNLNNQCKQTTLKAEIEYVKNYMRIQKIKYGEKIKLIVNLPEYLSNMQIPKYIMQPIVENSITHGFRGENNALTVTINVMLEGKDGIRIEVTDDGLGINEQDLKNMNISFEKSSYTASTIGGIGLRNINERLKLFYGDDHFIRMESVEGQYTKIILIIPFPKE